ncbi:DEAD/DEAH box helicase [Ekhidna sp.]|uniref:DEAD/DEAH box helicase n=1 Tax=Ekhidna sp. TaxID=2608089 RepID=UPI003C79E8F6
MDIVRGAYDKPISTEKLIRLVEAIGIPEGVLYTGYPIIGALNSSSLDAALISPSHGMILFDIVEEAETSEREEIRDNLFNAMVSRLISIKGLSKRRGQLDFDLKVLTYAPAWPKSIEESEELIINDQTLSKFIEDSVSDVNKALYPKILEAIQAITKLKQRPLRSVAKEDSKGAILNRIEKSISNLDRNQSQAVVETALGIQRIRGLAGSGKTVILALKAAYLHAKYPEWKIGVTYYTRSLKEQFYELITKFTIEQKNEEPDWTKIRLMQAWGSPSNEGFYYHFCKINNANYHTFDSAKRKYKTNDDLIGKISAEAIDKVKSPKSDFDVILIDEAQDFSESFLKLCYSLLKTSDPRNPANRRLVYAYDELQKLNELSLRSPKEIFGKEIDFENNPGKPKQDVILDVCYRNSAPVLVSAHGLGFGIYRERTQLDESNLVTMFQEKELWEDVGYEVVGGNLELGNYVELARSEKTSPAFLTSIVPSEEIIQFHDFQNAAEQNDWIADQIEINLREDELDYKDIIVIHPNALKAKTETSDIRGLLMKKGINSHLAGVSTSADDFFINDSIAFTSIYRAKGNEASMVYIMNTNYCFGGWALIMKRNTLFTAITRSKGWVRACGFGDSMKGLVAEFERVKTNGYQLKFNYPTKEQMEHLNVIHRQLSGEERKSIEQGQIELKGLVEKLESDQIKIQDLTKEDLERLKKLLNDAQ